MTGPPNPVPNGYQYDYVGSDAILRKLDVVDGKWVVFDENAPMADVLEFAMSSSHPAVVVANGRPKGMITADNLAALIQPLTGESFARSGEPAKGTADLLVAD